MAHLTANPIHSPGAFRRRLAGLFSAEDPGLSVQRGYRTSGRDKLSEGGSGLPQDLAHKSDPSGCPFRKFHPAWIRMIGQNHRMVVGDDRDPAFSRNVYHRSVQVAQPA